MHRYDRKGCTSCGRCAHACPALALETAGKEMTVDEVLTEVKKDEVFYQNSGGGMTLTGGEPFFQPRFAVALLALAKRDGMHTCVETCGAAAYDVLAEAAQYTDLFLYDVKETDSETHRTYTGAPNGLIFDNLAKLDASGAQTVLRCPVIPGVNDNERHFLGVCAMAGRLKNVQQIDIEPYHPLGISKAEAFGKTALHTDAKITPKETAEGWVAIFKQNTAVPVFIS